MTTTQRRTLAALLLGTTVLSLVLLPPTLFVIGIVVQIVIYLCGVAWHLYIDRAAIWSENVDLCAKVCRLEADIRCLEAKHAYLLEEVALRKHLQKGTLKAMGDALDRANALEVEHALCPAPVAQVVQLRPAPGTRGASS